MKRNKKMELTSITLLIASIILGVLGQVLFKMGTKELGPLNLKDIFSIKFLVIIFNKFVFSGLVCYALATLLWIILLSKAELSLVYPMLAIGYIIIAIVGRFVFGENVTLVRFLGTILIAIGVFLLLRS